MPFPRRTLPQLINDGATELESRLPGLLVRARRSLVGVINRVFAGAFSALYQYAEYLNRQSWPDICDKEYLPMHGARWGVRQIAAASATGTVTFVGVDGSVIAVGTKVQRSDGAQYTTDVDAEITGGVAAVSVTAVLPGQAGNANVGTSLSLSSPIANVSGTASATTALDGGADAEEPEPYRARILDRVRKPPQGGALPDYYAWAKEVPGVTRIWVYPAEQGLGSVVVRFVRDKDASPIPDVGEVADMQAHLDVVRPVTGQVYAVAPIATPLDFALSVTPNTPAVKAAVEAELAQMIMRDAVPGGTLMISHIREAASIAAGEDNHRFLSPTDDVVLSPGHLATMGAVTWL